MLVHRLSRASCVVVALVLTVAGIPTRAARATSAMVPTVDAVSGATEARIFHLRLEKSEPAKDTALAVAPKSIRLWFSLPPEMAVTQVKLTRADGTVIRLGTPHRGSGASDPVDVEISQPLAAGEYAVSWKTSSRDGHRVAGDFGFSVRAGR